METGIRESDLSASILKQGIRKTTTVMEESKAGSSGESEGELPDPMKVESEETCLREFEQDQKQQDTAMR
jgi:hypothetical protein